MQNKTDDSEQLQRNHNKLLEDTGYKLDDTDAKLLQLVLAYPGIKVRDLASALNINRTTVTNRMRKPAFKKAYADYTKDVLDSIAELQKAAAVELRGLLKSKHDMVKLLAIKAILYEEPKIISRIGGANNAMPTIQYDLGDAKALLPERELGEQTGE